MKHLAILFYLIFIYLNLKAQTSCDSLSFDIEYSAFNDSLLSIKFENNSSNFFSGPSIFLIANNLDTIAKEAYPSFGIGQDFTTALKLYPNWYGKKDFAATLEIWTSINDSLECSYLDSVQLCQIDSCVDLYPGVANFGGALVNGTVQWNVFKSGANQGSGSLVLIDPSQQSDRDTICLAPNKYRFEYAAAGPLGGQLYAQLAIDDETSFYSEAFSGFAGIIDVDLYKQCRPSTNSVENIELDDPYFATLVAGNKLFIETKQFPFELKIRNINGQEIINTEVNNASDFVDLTELSSGMYFIQHENQSSRIFKNQ